MKPLGSAILTFFQLERSEGSSGLALGLGWAWREPRACEGRMVARGQEPARPRDERNLAGARACEGGWLRRATCEPAERRSEPARRAHP
jgi:hypothetical protein